MNTTADVCHIELKLARFKIAEIKTLLRSLDLRLSGNKAELINRVLQFINAGNSTGQDPIKIYTVRVLTMHLLDGTPDIPKFTDLYKHYKDSGLLIEPPSNQAQPELQHPPRDKLHPLETTPHVGHSLYFRTSPFYSAKRMIHTSPQLIVAAHDGRCNMSFVLNDAEMKLYQQSKAGVRFYLYCGKITNKRSASSHDVYIEFPSAMRLTVNDKVYKSSVNGIKGKKGTGRAADITDYLLPSPNLNKVSLLYQGIQDSYLMYLYAVQVVPPSQLLQTVKETHSHISVSATIEKIKQQFAVDDDDDIAISNLNVSLKDSLTLTKIRCPVRSVFCTHVDCFDGLTFLESQFQIPTWQCPLCLMSIKFRDLSVSDYFVDVLSKTPDEVDLISINEDGTWKSDDIKEDPGSSDLDNFPTENPTVVAKDNDIIVLDSDEDEEDEGEESVPLLSTQNINTPSIANTSGPSAILPSPINAAVREPNITPPIPIQAAAVVAKEAPPTVSQKGIQNSMLNLPDCESGQVSFLNGSNTSQESSTVSGTIPNQPESRIHNAADNRVSNQRIGVNSLRHGTVFAQMHTNRNPNAIPKHSVPIVPLLSEDNESDVPLSEIPRDENSGNSSVELNVNGNQNSSSTSSSPTTLSHQLSATTQQHKDEEVVTSGSNSPPIIQHTSPNPNFSNAMDPNAVHRRNLEAQRLKMLQQNQLRVSQSNKYADMQDRQPQNSDYQSAFARYAAAIAQRGVGPYSTNQVPIQSLFQDQRLVGFGSTAPNGFSGGQNNNSYRPPQGHAVGNDPRMAPTLYANPRVNIGENRGLLPSNGVQVSSLFPDSGQNSANSGGLQKQFLLMSSKELLSKLSRYFSFLDKTITSSRSLGIGRDSLETTEFNEIMALMTRTILSYMMEMKSRGMGLVELAGVILLLHFKNATEANLLLMKCWNRPLKRSPESVPMDTGVISNTQSSVPVQRSQVVQHSPPSSELVLRQSPPILSAIQQSPPIARAMPPTLRSPPIPIALLSSSQSPPPAVPDHSRDLALNSPATATATATAASTATAATPSMAMSPVAAQPSIDATASRAPKRPLESHVHPLLPPSKRSEADTSARRGSHGGDFSLDQIIEKPQVPPSAGSESSSSIEFIPSSPVEFNETSDNLRVEPVVQQAQQRAIQPKEPEKAPAKEAPINNDNPRRLQGLLGIVLNNDLMDIVQE